MPSRSSNPTLPPPHPQSIRPGVYVQAWRSIRGEHVVVGIGADGRSVTEAPLTARTPAELAAACSRLTALVFPPQRSPGGGVSPESDVPVLPDSWPSDAQEMAPGPDALEGPPKQQLRAS